MCVVAALYCGIKGIRKKFHSAKSFLYKDNLNGLTEQFSVDRRSQPYGFWYAVILWSLVSLLVLAYGVALIIAA